MMPKITAKKTGPFPCSSSLLQKKVLEALEWLCEKLPDHLSLLVGLPLQVENHLYNAAAFISNHQVLGFYAKNYLPNYNEYYEPRWFTSALYLPENATVHFMKRAVPVRERIVFEDFTTGAVIGPEICEDLWVSIPVSSRLAAAGANVLCNLSASNEVIAKEEYRTSLVLEQSARNYAAYIYASAGPDESSSDLVFGGQKLIAENGHILAQSSILHPQEIITAQIDLEILKNERMKYKTSFESLEDGVTKVPFASKPVHSIELKRTVNAYPFVPSDLHRRIARCQKILTIQATGLATRLKKIRCSKVVLGISGGLDSTLALLVCVRAFDLLHLDKSGIIAVTLPGFGTTDHTKSNAMKLMELLHVTTKVIPIADAVNIHFRDIDQDPNTFDITYENSQARERTQILMDLANKENALVIGTGDLSELALGWCTYNGDHMSMYGINAGIPKTLVKYLTHYFAMSEYAGEERKALLDILDTPISPELLPAAKDGRIEQKTEDLVGPYELHDFFLFYTLRYGFTPSRIFMLATVAFKDRFERATILKWERIFFRRFFNQQFKRSCLPDGPKVGSVALSPRGDLRMPSDAVAAIWLKQLEEL